MEKINPILEKLYKRLDNELTLKKKKNSKERSLLESLLNIKSVERYKILDSISIDSKVYFDNEINDLLSLKEIRMTNHCNQYTLTALGIWKIETQKKELSISTLLEIIDDKYFDNIFTKNSPINIREKIVLFLFITLRAFSVKSYIHLKINDTDKNKLKKLIEDCYEILLSLDLIEENENNLSRQEIIFGKPGNEHPVSNLIRHTDQLPKKTKTLYASLRDQKYFLNLFNEEDPNLDDFERNLDYIVRIVFIKELDEDQYERTYNFMIDSYNKYYLLFFDIREHRFDSPEFSEIYEKVFNRLKSG